MGDDDDVEMGDARAATAAVRGSESSSQRSAALLNAVVTGDLSALAQTSSSRSLHHDDRNVDAETERLLLTPFLPLLARLDHARNTHSNMRSITATHAISTLLVRYEHVNVLRDYARVFETLQVADIVRVAQQQQHLLPAPLRHDSKSSAAAAAAAADTSNVTMTPIYRAFENGDACDRVCLVLAHVYAYSVESLSVATSPAPAASVPAASVPAASVPAAPVPAASELFVNAIYCDEVAAILVLALASPALCSADTDSAAASDSTSRMSLSLSLSLPAIVRFCLSVPLGVALLERVVQNDPSAATAVVDTVVTSLAALPPPTNATVGNALPAAFERALATCRMLATFAPAIAMHVRDALSAQHSHGSSPSLYAIAAAFDVSIHVPSLQRDLALFVYRMLKREALVGAAAAAGAGADVSAFSAYLSLALDGETPAAEHERTTPPTNASESPLQRIATQHVLAVRQQLIMQLTSATASLDVVLLLNVLIGLLVQSQWRPTESETTTLLRWLERTAQAQTQLQTQPQMRPSQPLLTGRVVSLAYVLVVLLCYPLAPALHKIPSQRDDATKRLLALAQQTIVALYSTRAACPLFILSAVLLYTKSPALLPCLASVVDNDGLSVMALRSDFLFVVGDVVLKPILTENIMAREVLTFGAAPPFSSHVATTTTDVLADMALRSVHGLLSEKSFLRHHHGRALELWVAAQVAQAALPVAPLLLNVLLEWVENYVVAFEYPLATTPVLTLAIVPLRSATVAKWLRAPCLTEPFVLRSESRSESESDLASDTARKWSCGVLALTYALQFNQRVRHAMMVTGSKIRALAPQPPPTGSDVVLCYDVSDAPLQHMLTTVLAHSRVGAVFEYIAPTLLRLLVEEFPHRVARALVVSPRLGLMTTTTMAYASSTTSLNHDAIDWRAPSTWLRLQHQLTTLATAPTRIVQRAFDALVQRVVPLLLLASIPNDAAANATVSRESLFAQVAVLIERCGPRAHPQQTMQLVHALCFPDVVHLQHTQQQQHAVTSSHSSRTNSNARLLQSHVVTYSELVEEPFRLLRDAHAVAIASPALLRVLLQLVCALRTAANAHLKAQDPALAPRRQQLLATAAASASASTSDATGSNASSLLVARTAAVLQHMLVQDCLVVHALLQRLAVAVAAAAADTDDDAARECTRVLCSALNDLLSDGDGSHHSALPPYRLVAAVHEQSYARALVPVLVANVPAMRLLWDHWLAPTPSTSSSNSSNSNTPGAPASGRSSATSSSSSSTASHGRALQDFVAFDGAEKDLRTWAFRLDVFFALCGAYFTAPTQTPAVLQTLRLVLNRVRTALLAAIAAAGASAGDSSAADDARSRHAAFLDRVLPRAVAACAQHAELSAELVQFLLKLQKQSSSSSSSATGRSKLLVTSSSSGGATAVAASRSHSSGKDLDDVLREAYALLLEQI